MVHRSLLALKLLTFKPTGAIVAAPTCSLPEIIGGTRNWDYRYTWIRDAAFTVYAFMRVGLTEEAGEFMKWLQERATELTEEGTPQIMYRLDGGHSIREENLDHLSGYRNSKPVRVGNGAYDQMQLDIFGELMDFSLPLQQVRLADLIRPLEPPPQDDRLGSQQLEAS